MKSIVQLKCIRTIESEKQLNFAATFNETSAFHCHKNVFNLKINLSVCSLRQFDGILPVIAIVINKFIFINRM